MTELFGENLVQILQMAKVSQYQACPDICRGLANEPKRVNLEVLQCTLDKTDWCLDICSYKKAMAGIIKMTSSMILQLEHRYYLGTGMDVLIPRQHITVSRKIRNDLHHQNYEFASG